MQWQNKNMKIIITEDQKKKLFRPIGLSGEDSRWVKLNKEQPIKDGVRINQYTHDGKQDGYWESYWDNGELASKGSYVDGKKEGYWEYYADGKLTAKGSYINGKEEGIWEYYYDNGKLFGKGSYINGEKEGIWEYYYENGKLYSKELYKNSKVIKELPLTEAETPKKKLFRPIGLSGEDSRWLQWNKEQPIKDGVQINQYTHDGKKTGYWDNWIDDDEMIIGKGFFIKGVKQGMWEEYLSSGELLGKGNYKNGKEDGIWEFYDEDGDLERKELFQNGRIVGVWHIKKDDLTEGKNLNEGQVYSYKLDPSHSDPNNRRIIYNFTGKDDYQFEVIFYNLGDNKWEREYSTIKKGLGLLNTNDVYNIMETITKITLDFIERYQPENITIFHISKNKEANGIKPSKRALLNKRYLDPAINKLDDYYYKLLGSTSYISKL